MYKLVAKVPAACLYSAISWKGTIACEFCKSSFNEVLQWSMCGSGLHLPWLALTTL